MSINGNIGRESDGEVVLVDTSGLPVTVTGTNALKVDNSAVTQPISAASLPLPSGAATEATLTKLPLAQGSTTSGQSGVLEQGAVTTSSPTYITGQTSPLSLTTAGALRTDSSATTQPISGSVSVSNFPATQNVAITSSVEVEIKNDTSNPIPVSGTVSAAQSGTWTVQPGNTANTTAWKVDGSAVTQPISAASLPLPSGAATSALQTSGNASLASIAAGIPAALGQATMAASMPVVLASDQSAIPVTQSGTWTFSSTASNRTTYAAAVTNLSITATAATDIFTITGSATKVIRILRIDFSGTTTAGSGIFADASLIIRSTVDTAGTFTTLTNVPLDSTDAAGTVAVKAYTANPTLGTTRGAIQAERLGITSTGSNAYNARQWSFESGAGKPLILRGTSQQAALNLGGVSITNPKFAISVIWTEE